VPDVVPEVPPEELVAFSPDAIWNFPSIVTFAVPWSSICWLTFMSFTFKPVPEIVIFPLVPTAGAMLKVCEKALLDCVDVAFSTELAVPPVVPVLPEVVLAPPLVAPDGVPEELLTLPAVELLALPDAAPEVVSLPVEVLLEDVLLLEDDEFPVNLLR
jgi:hypothetical protein